MLRWLAYTLAGVLILLAIAVGLFRLLLPQLPEYQAEIESRLSAAVGLPVEFESLDARWRFSGPELLARNVVVYTPDNSETLAEAEAVVVGVSVGSMLTQRRVVPNRLVLTGVEVALSRAGDAWLVNNRPLDEIVPDLPATDERQDFRIAIENSLITYQVTKDTPGIGFRINEADIIRSATSDTLTVDFERDLPDRRPLVLEIEKPADSTDAFTIYARLRDVAVADFAPVLPPTIPRPDAGRLTLDLWLNVADGAIRGANATFGLDALAWQPGVLQTVATELDLAGKMEWSRTPTVDIGGFDLSRLKFNNSDWSPSSGEVRLEYDDDRRLAQIDGRASYLNLGDLDALAGDALRALQLIPEVSITGELSGASLTMTAPLDPESRRYRLEGRLSEFGLSGLPGERAVSGLTATFTADTQAGSARLTSGAFSYTDPALFKVPLRLGALGGGLTWRSGSRGVAILSDRLTTENDVFQMAHNFELLLPREGSGPEIDLGTEFSVSDVKAAVAFLPTGVMNPRLTKWFEDALVQGSLADGELKLVGPLRAFPFDNDEGEFAVRARYNDGVLAFNGRWPSAEVDTAVVAMEGMRLYSHENTGSVLGNPASNAIVEIEDVRETVLVLKSRGRSDVADGLNLVRQSPIRDLFGERIDDVSGRGVVDYNVELEFPVRQREKFTITVGFEFSDAELALQPFTQKLTQITGSLDLTRETLSASSLTAQLLGSPVAIELLRAAPDTGSSVIIVGSGAVKAEDLQAEFSHPAMALLSGATTYRSTVRFPSKARPGAPAPQPLSIRVESDLTGLGIDAPVPLRKAAATKAQLQSRVVFPEQGVLWIDGSMTGRGSWVSRLVKRESDWAFDRGGLELGDGVAELPVGSGLFISGETATLRLAECLDFGGSLRTGDNETALLRGLNLQVGTLFAYGQKVTDVGLQVDRNANDWLIQVNAEHIAGGLFVPLDLKAGRPIVMQMDRLRLLESDPEATTGQPKNIPAININVADFQLGEHRFGELEARIVATEYGIETRDLSTRHPAFSTVGSGSWLINSDGEAITALTTELISTDTRVAANTLGINSTIDANDAIARLDLRWPGAPRRDFWGELDGAFSIVVNNGRLDEVDPGAGRVLGLMSVVELPRRLALDFRDVFSKGLSFDRITADYRIVNGEAYTCNLSLEGPAADIAVIGRTGLSRRNYNQTAVVRPKVGNTLPAVGAVMGGPQVAAALLLVSRIFKKPLRDIGQAYYQVNGSWDEPTIERTTVERFYATGQLADCLQTTP